MGGFAKATENGVMVMKFTIVVRSKGKFLEIPLSVREVHVLQDLPFMIDDIWESHIVPNKMEKEVKPLNQKFMFLGYDVKDDGRTYNTAGKMIEHCYLVKKPKWKNPATYMFAGGTD